MRLVWILVLLTISFVLPFIIWGSEFENAFSTDGEWLRKWGNWAWLIAILLLMSDLILPIPGTAVMVTLGLIYGPIVGGIVGSIGSILSGVVAYLLCLKFGREIAIKIAGDKAIQQGENIFERTGAWLVVLSRWLPVMPEVIACMAGLSRMPSRLFIAALATGSIPLAFIFSIIGASSKENPKLTIILSILAPAVLWLFVRPVFIKKSGRR